MAVKQIQTLDELEEYEFVDVNGKHLYTIAFNAADIDIARRYKTVEDWLDKTLAELDKHKNASDEETLEKIFEISDEFGKKLDYMLNADVSKQIFSVMNPFSPLQDGRTYAESVLENIQKVIESEVKAREQRKQARMEKYTAEYKKK